MPHVSIEYSGNIDDVVDMGAFCTAIRDACLETGVFPFAGIRVRATRVDHFVIADGDPGHMFMDISVRLRGGRDLETRKSATANTGKRKDTGFQAGISDGGTECDHIDDVVDIAGIFN